MKVIELELFFKFVVIHYPTRYCQQFRCSNGFAIVCYVLLLLYYDVKLLVSGLDTELFKHCLDAMCASMLASLEPSFPAHKLWAYRLVGEWVVDDAMSVNSGFVAKSIFPNYRLVWLDDYAHGV